MSKNEMVHRLMSYSSRTPSEPRVEILLVRTLGALLADTNARTHTNTRVYVMTCRMQSHDMTPRQANIGGNRKGRH